jgi:hypothetical protein
MQQQDEQPSSLASSRSPDGGSGGGSGGSGGAPTSSSAFHEKALLNYPAPLRPAAAAATLRWMQKQRLPSGSTADGAAATAEAGGTAGSEQARKELQRVEALLKTARTDMELWQVLDDEVFTLIKRLERISLQPDGGEEDMGTIEENSRLIGPPASAATAATTASEPGHGSSSSQGDDRDDGGAPMLLTAVSNYPYLLRLALRILRYELRLPDACLTLFRHVKALGPVSYILGATTEVYNEMIIVLWKSYADFAAIDGLLAEMENAGVEFDEQTEKLLHSIVHEQHVVDSGELGPVMKDMWKLAGLDAGLNRVSRWAHIATGRLIEKAARTAEEETKEEIE